MPRRTRTTDTEGPTATAAGPFVMPGRHRVQQPTIGRIVHYTLTQDDANTVNRRRAGRAIRERLDVASLGNRAAAGDVFPATVVRVGPRDLCNLQVALDGADGLWVTSRAEGTEPGTWAWPVRTSVRLLLNGCVPSDVQMVGPVRPAAASGAPAAGSDEQ